MTMERYRIESLVARGEMGEVHRAFDMRLQRAVALKVVRRDRVDDIGPDRLLREARAAAALRHPNIVVVYDVGTDNDGAYIAMELVDGEPLRAFLGTGDLARKLGWLREIALALAAAHAAGLVHRDIKPDNVIVTRAGVAKVLDFGIAKRTFSRDDTTHSLSAAGTPAYVAPEQRAGGPATPATDQFAWAVVAVELVTGERIVDPDRAERALTRAGVPERVAETIARALAESPARRWPSMAAIAAELDAAGVTVPSIADVAPKTRPTVGALPSRVSSPSPPRRRMWIAAVGACAAITGASIAWLALRGTPPGPGTCGIAGIVSIDALPPAQQPLEIGVCEGQILVSSNTDGVPLEGIAPIDRPLRMHPVQLLGVDAKFALPLCIANGTAAFADWGGTPRAPFKTTTAILPPDHTLTPGASIASTAFSTPAPCAFAVHPIGSPIFAVCEHASSHDPRLLLRFEHLAKYEIDTRDPNDPAKPHTVVAAYPFDDRPLVAYRAGDRLVGMFPSMIGAPNEARFEIAHGVIGEPAAIGAGDAAVVVWPEHRDGFVLRAAEVSRQRGPQPIDTGAPRTTATAPAIARLGHGFVLAWIGDGGLLEVGAGDDLATAVARARPIAGVASHVRIATNGDKIAIAWRDLAGAGHVARLACELP